MQVNTTLTVQDAFEQFQQYNRTKNLSPETISYYDCYYRRLCEYLEDTSIPISTIDQAKVESYIRYLQQKGTMTDTTVNTRYAWCGRFCTSPWIGGTYQHLR